MPTRQPGQKRTRNRREYDRQEIARLRLREYTQAEIATAMGLSLSTVKRELSHLHQAWQAEARADTSVAMAMELRRLNTITREAWKGWELSLKDQTATTVEDGSTKTKTTTTAGDPRYLNAMMSAIERRCKIMGIDAPAKLAATTGSGEDVQRGIFVVPAPAGSVAEWMDQVHAYEQRKEAEGTSH
jgi:DNA-binding transcriptional MerR regulator